MFKRYQGTVKQIRTVVDSLISPFQAHVAIKHVKSSAVPYQRFVYIAVGKSYTDLTAERWREMFLSLTLSFTK
jgi:hypothetical protein